MSETLKQEGDFKLKSKPKKFMKPTNEPIKVDLSAPNVQGAVVPEVTKVVIKKDEENAIQEQSSESAVLRESEPVKETGEEPKVELSTVGQGDEGAVKNVIQEITEDEVKETVKEVKEALRDVTRI